MLALYYIYFFLIAVPVLFSLTVLTCIVILIGTAIGNGSWWGYYPAMVWAKVFCILSLVKVSVRGRENIDKRTSYVFVANHQGAYDIFSIYGYLGHNFRWMMKKGLMKIPVVGASCLVAGHIFVDNSSASAIRRTMEKAEKSLRGGMSLVVFPEGSRTFTGKIGPFRKGAYQLAMEFGLPVVPVTIDGAFEVMPRTAFAPHWGTIRLTIHKPIDPPVDEADRKRVIDASYEAVRSALPERYR